jgi:hypothetical protein
MNHLKLKATVDMQFRQMKVTRNLDDDSDQDPFLTLFNFKLTKAEWAFSKEKYKHDV